MFFRYVLNSSLSWSEEAARYLFIWSAVLGFSSSVEAQRLFRFDMVARRLPPLSARLCAGLYGAAAVALPVGAGGERARAGRGHVLTDLAGHGAARWR